MKKMAVEAVTQAEKDIEMFKTMVFFIGGAVGFTIADLISEKKGGGAGILLELD